MVDIVCRYGRYFNAAWQDVNNYELVAGNNIVIPVIIVIVVIPVIIVIVIAAGIFLQTGARCSSVVRAFAHGTMGRRIDPSWGGPIELFLVPASAPRQV